MNTRGPFEVKTYVLGVLDNGHNATKHFRACSVQEAFAFASEAGYTRISLVNIIDA